MNKQIKSFLPLVLLVLFGFFIGVNSNNLKNIVAGPLSLFAPSRDTVSAGQLKEMLKNKNLPAGRQGFTLINVHTPYEGEIAKTDTFIPYDQIIADSANLPKNKNAAIVLYCKSGRMSAEALQTIRKLGYTNVRHLSGGMEAWEKSGGKLIDLSGISEEVLPAEGVELPVTWRDLGTKLVSAGVIDLSKFKETVKPTDAQEKILTEGSDEKIRIDAGNSQFIVDVLWALGLANKSLVYTEGPMGKEYKKDAGNFASTGGWTLSRGPALNYLNQLDLIPLTPDQQQKVARIAKNVYRPCCGNSTWFPDCNHGMAALALIELMVAKNVDEKTIYRKILGFNSFWFSESYLYTATYFARLGTSWDKVDAQMVLGEAYSSAKGAQTVASKVGSLPFKQKSGGGACGA